MMKESMQRGADNLIDKAKDEPRRLMTVNVVTTGSLGAIVGAVIGILLLGTYAVTHSAFGLFPTYALGLGFSLTYRVARKWISKFVVTPRVIAFSRRTATRWGIPADRPIQSDATDISTPVVLACTATCYFLLSEATSTGQKAPSWLFIYWVMGVIICGVGFFAAATEALCRDKVIEGIWRNQVLDFQPIDTTPKPPSQTTS